MVRMQDTRFPGNMRYVGSSDGQVIGPNRFAPDGNGPAPSYFDGETVMVILEDDKGVGQKPIPLSYVLARCWGAKETDSIGFRDGNPCNVKIDNLFWPGFPKPPVVQPPTDEPETIVLGGGDEGEGQEKRGWGDETETETPEVDENGEYPEGADPQVGAIAVTEGATSE